MSSMAISPLVTLVFSMFLVLQSTTNAFNITDILSQYKPFGGYNALLVDNGVAAKINSLVAVTVLVVSDDQLFYFNNLPKDVVNKILRFHVILDYYDESKLKSLKSSTRLPTLNQDATLTADHDSRGSVVFKSGSNTGVKLLATIESQFPSISVLEIASIVLMNGAFDRSSPLLSSTPPTQSPSIPPTGSTASPPRKILVPPPTPRNEPPPASSSSTKGNNAPPPSQRPNASSPVPWPQKPSSTPGAADGQAPSPNEESSAHARICYENYLDYIVMVFAAVWFIFIMN